MISREQTSVLKRRYLSFLIDSGLVLVTGLALAWSRAEKLDIISRDATGRPIWTEAEQAKVIDIANFKIAGVREVAGIGLARYQEFGDTAYLFGERAIIPGFLAMLLAAFTLFAIVPAIMGRTLGMIPTGLRIGDLEGKPARVVSHLVRSFVGLVDLLPLVLPGLVGFLVANRSRLNQRLGDRVAGTVVFHPARAAATAPGFELSHTTPADAQAATAPSGGAGFETRTSLDPRPDNKSDTPQPSHEPLVHEPILEESPVPAAPDTHGEVDGSVVGTDEELAGELTDPAEWIGAESVDNQPADTALDESPFDESPVGESRLEDPPLEESVLEPSPLDDQLLDDQLLDDEDEPLLPPPPSHRPRRETSGHTPRSESEPQAQTGSTQDGSAPDGSAPDGSGLPEADWDAPTAEPAPVWRPEEFDAALPAFSPQPNEIETEPVPSQAAEPQTEPDLEIETEVASPSSDDESPTGARRQGDDMAGTSKNADGSAPATRDVANAPVWSEKWEAWLYWDPKGRRWLRHDERIDTWIPIS